MSPIYLKIGGKEIEMEKKVIDGTKNLASAGMSRRDFLKSASVASIGVAVASAAASAVSAASVASISRSGGLFASGGEKIKVGIIGCGGRGTGAALDCAAASPDVVIVALGDLFPDMLESSRKYLGEKLSPDRLQVTPATCFTGFDAYEKVLKADVDLVILAAPPFFRPAHLKAAIDAGKHVFLEKPMGINRGECDAIIAAQKRSGRNLTVDFEMRHSPFARRMRGFIDKQEYGKLDVLPSPTSI